MWYIPDFLKESISEAQDELRTMIVDTEKKVPDERFKNRIDKIEIITANISFLLLVVILSFASIVFVLKWMYYSGHRIDNYELNAGGLENTIVGERIIGILIIIFLAVIFYGYLKLVNLLFYLRNYVKLYNLLRFYAYFEILNYFIFKIKYSERIFNPLIIQTLDFIKDSFKA